MTRRWTRPLAYLLAALLSYGIAMTLGSGIGLMAFIAVGLFTEVCFWREVLLGLDGVPDHRHHR